MWLMRGSLQGCWRIEFTGSLYENWGDFGAEVERRNTRCSAHTLAPRES